MGIEGNRGAVTRIRTSARLTGVRAIGGAPMTRDTIFRIPSMAKPIVAATALALVDDATLRLDDSIERWLPELANRRVLVHADGPLTETVPARRAITVRDLLTFCMGFGVLWGAWDCPAVRTANELELGAFGPPHPQQPPAPDEWLRRFSTLPLMAQPGERWLYNTSAEVLSVLIARAAARPLEVIMRERILEPLGMGATRASSRPTGSRRAIASPSPGHSSSTTRWAASGRSRRHFRRARPAWCRRSTTSSCSHGCCSPVAGTVRFACCRSTSSAR